MWTINSILLLWNELKQSGTKFLLTSFLNQDPLENLFSVIRHRGGYNPRPSVRQFRIALQNNIKVRLLSDSNSNCEEDHAENLDLEERNNESTTTTDNEDNEEKENYEELNQVKVNTLEKCSNVYVAGYLIHSFSRRYNCQDCLKILCNQNEILNQETELLIINKDFSKGEEIKFLKRPSDLFSEVVTFLFLKFNDGFYK